MNFKGLIFDLDGLLVDSEELQIEAEKLTLQKLGVVPTKKEIAGGIGWTITHWAEYYRDKYKLKVTVKELLDYREKIFFTKADKELKKMPGAEKLLKLANKLEYKTALASSNYRKYINFVLNKFKWENYFKIVLGEEDVKEGKPSPELFLKAAKLLKLDLSNCVVFEDSYNGILAANLAKIKSIAVGENAMRSRFSKASRQLKSLETVNEEFLELLWN